MNIAFRVDASASMGLGHLRRCLSLAQALRTRGATCRIVSRNLGLVPIAALAEGFDSLTLPPPGPAVVVNDPVAHAAWAGVGWRQDADDTLTALQGQPVEWLVLDHYAFDARWHRAVRVGLDCRIAVIDDLADRALDADLVIDHNHATDHRQKYAGCVAAGTELLGGPSFGLLSAVYADAPRHLPQAEVASIGIFMGGTDADQLSAMALAGCDLAGFSGPVEIASTSANPRLDDLQQAVSQRPHTRLMLDQPDLADFFARHTVQIGAGGGATWERCCIGAATLALIAADNQRLALEPLAGLGVLAAVDSVPPTAPAIATALRPLLGDAALRSSLSANAQRLVDGRGAWRVAERLLAPQPT